VSTYLGPYDEDDEGDGLVFVPDADIDLRGEDLGTWETDPRSSDEPIEVEDPGFSGYTTASDYDDWAVNPATEFDD